MGSNVSNWDGPPAIASQITALGLAYSLLTRHTSFVAVLEPARRTSARAHDVDQASPLPQGMSDPSGAAYAYGSEPQLWLLVGITGLVLLLLRKVR